MDTFMALAEEIVLILIRLALIIHFPHKKQTPELHGVKKNAALICYFPKLVSLCSPKPTSGSF